MRNNDWMTLTASTSGTSAADALQCSFLRAARIRASTFLDLLPEDVATVLIQVGRITRVPGTTYLTQAEDGGGSCMYHMSYLPRVSRYI